MKNKTLASFVLVAAITTVAGCGSDQPAPPARDTAAAAPAANAPAAPGAAAPGAEQAAPAATVDQASPSALQAGIEAMGTRIAATVDGYSKIEPTPTFRYFMHPTVDKVASIEFNTGDLSSITLSPRIGDLSPECAQDPKAGIVEMRYSIDGGAPTTVAVDRAYNALIPLDVSKAQKLKVDVANGNGTDTCDWFGLGVLDVKTR